MVIKGRIFDVLSRSINEGEITINNGKISGIELKPVNSDVIIMPGLIDAHIHIESSMLVPSEFARIAVKHGTVAVVSDPHEIANVLGIEGIEYMLDNATDSPFKFYFGAPSCVPATQFETSGTSIDAADVSKLLNDDRIKYLSEMMNYPGVIYNSPDMVAKIEAAKSFNKPIDGHAPGLSGINLKKYIQSGISTDHECTTLTEAIEKVNLGMKILIRNGSAAKNFDTLHSLIKTHNSMVMLCSDDLHPDDLMNGHINLLVKKALIKGHDIFDILTACIVNPALHYKLDVGLLRPGDPADMIIADNLLDFNIFETLINGKSVYSENGDKEPSGTVKILNHFNAAEYNPDDFNVPFNGGKLRVIEVVAGELITNSIILNPTVVNGSIIADPVRDILKISVINRYQNAKPAVAFIRNFGIQSGAIASSVAHDSHNIVCIGTNDDDISIVVNEIIKNKGGIAVCNNGKVNSLPLPVAGIMSDKSCEYVAAKYIELDKIVKEMGSHLESPLMTLSFMALIVIPELKLSDKGLFDVNQFKFVDLQIN